MKLSLAIAVCCLAPILTTAAVAQAPVAAPATATGAQDPKTDALTRAFFDAEARRSTIAAAAAQLVKLDAAGRARFVANLGAVTAVAPKPAARPVPASGEKVPVSAEAKPAEAAEFSEATKALMTTVVKGSAEEAKDAVAKLATETEALTRLAERGTAILEQGLASLISKRVATNALFAGQYEDLKDFEPAAGPLLLRWSAKAPTGVSDAPSFSTACLRALRDIVPADKGTDEMRAALRDVAEKSQHARRQQAFLTAACALHQYGDTSLFDGIKADVEKQLASESVEAKTAANNTLAELYYQLRDYENAANHYKALLDIIEKQPQQPDGVTTLIYNTACSLALAKHIDESFQYLEKALTAKGGQLSKAMIDSDHDMDNLRADPRFAKLIEQHFSKSDPHGK
ncbi:MAG TPA: hypothetical protein VFZ65_08070 [Planctomycetota bacterium]|nr:hypothetical protein [Planctomycetota bacterium]